MPEPSAQGLEQIVFISPRSPGDFCFTQNDTVTTALPPPDYGSTPEDPGNAPAHQSLTQGHFVLEPTSPWILC